MNSNFSKSKEKKIFEEGEKIYPISQNSDEKCAKLHKIENWAEVFYYLKEGKIKERYIELMKCSGYTLFFEGLNYEYGINNYPLNLKKAFEIYKEAANNTTDTMSTFRLYNIYKNEFKKFNISKRNRICEKFYIFKCYSFLRYPLMNRDEFLCNKFDILLEISIHSEEEDEYLNKFHKFIFE